MWNAIAFWGFILQVISGGVVMDIHLAYCLILICGSENSNQCLTFS
jgi:hypothetical protein